MTPQERMALALAYQQRRPNLGDLSPEQMTAMQAPTQQPTMSFFDRLSETGAGIGKGLANTVEGMGQMVTAPIETGKEMYRNVSDVVSNPSLIVDALKQMGEKATSSPAGFGEVVGENINPRNLAKTLAKGLAKPVMQELIVAHGSPHRFPPTANNPLGEFDASKIGTGEGAQVYGHGIYLAESPDVAGSYRTALSNPEVVLKTGERIANPVIGSPEDVAKAWLEEAYLANDKTPFDTAIARVSKLRKAANSQAQFDGAIKVLNEWKKSGATVDRGGALYTVDLPDEKIAQMLDWDKPFSEQSAYVQKAIMNNDLLKPYVEKMNAKIKQLNEADPARLTHPVIGKLAKKVYDVDSMKGQDAYDTIASHFNSREQASEFLRQAGIPGIKYLDEGSRNTSGKWIAKHPQGGENAFNTEAELNAYIKRNPEYAAVNPKQTRNFVVFPGEEKHLKILERK